MWIATNDGRIFSVENCGIFIHNHNHNHDVALGLSPYHLEGGWHVLKQYGDIKDAKSDLERIKDWLSAPCSNLFQLG
jgi:hypothetical protein